jgi:hypothetical protein
LRLRCAGREEEGGGVRWNPFPLPKGVVEPPWTNKEDESVSLSLLIWGGATPAAAANDDDDDDDDDDGRGTRVQVVGSGIGATGKEDDTSALPAPCTKLYPPSLLLSLPGDVRNGDDRRDDVIRGEVIKGDVSRPEKAGNDAKRSRGEKGETGVY